jgi:GNAT superfamily N-acetyltransferase
VIGGTRAAAAARRCSWSRRAARAATTEHTVERILAFIHRIEDESATSLQPFRWGTAVFNSEFPRSWAHNFLRVDDAPDVGATELVAEAERFHSAAGHAHRQVSVDDAATGARLEPGFARAGWTVERLVLMVHRRPPEEGVDPSLAREASFDEVRPALEGFYAEAPFGNSAETVRQLVERSLLTARAANVRHFAVFVDGRVVSTCDLYSDGATAQIEDVSTFAEFRNRGFARATVLQALGVARAEGNDLVFLEADDRDWPKQFYGRLGFDEVAHRYHFTRPGDPG